MEALIHTPSSVMVRPSHLRRPLPPHLSRRQGDGTPAPYVPLTERGGDSTSSLQWRGGSHHPWSQTPAIAFFFLIFFASLELFLLYFENTSLFVFFRNTFQFTRQIFFYGLQGQPLHRKHFTIFTFSKNSFHNLTFLSGNVKFIVRGDMNQTTFGLDV